MNQREKIQHLTQENVLQAIERIKEEGVPSARESNTYDLVYEGVVYPPKYITSLAGFFSGRGQFILGSTFAGGEDSKCFAILRELGFDILPKEETKDFLKPKEADRKMHYKYCYRVIDEQLNEGLFKEHFIEYVRYCRESAWFSVAEAYKFRFGRWMSENINLDTQSDEEVLAKCNESQDQSYDAEGKAKGVNFIVSQKRYQDEFISLIDVQNIRRIKNGELLNDYDLKESPLSFPKFSVWAGVLLPENSMIFGSDELTNGIAHLFHLDDYPKSGVRAFNLANVCLKEIKVLVEREYKDEAQELIQQVFPGANMDPVDWVWLVQDFILFLNRRVLSTAKNYFWVFQGDNYQVEKENGIVAAPVDKIHHHKRLREMREGDVVIHYANSAIRALSTVVKEFVIAEKPYLRDKSENLIVEVDYNELSQPIKAQEIAKKFKDHKDLLPAKYSPLTKDLSANQVYMAAFNEASYSLLFNECNYWVFQGSPKLFDFETALRNEILTDWTVSAHKDKIKIGDKVVLWITGSDAGCYALAEVTSEPHTRTTSADDHLWKEEDNSELKADIKVTHNLVNNPILKTEIDSLAKLKNLKVGNQGTNFSASKEEYEKLLSMYSISEPKNYWVYSPGENAMYWDTFYEEGILGLGWNELGDISRFNDKDEIVKELQRIEETDSSKKNDATANWDFIHRVNVGDVIIAKKGRQELLGYGIVTSGYYYDPSRPDQHHLRKIEWKLKGSWPISDNLSLKTLTIITEYGCELPEFEFYYQRLLADMGVDVPRIKKEIMPINQILYGPPGTGKTYHLKTELFPRYTARESSVTKDDFVKEIVGDLSWWKVVALVLKEMKAGKVSDIREHKFLKVKESLSNSNTVKQTIWGQLQAHTVEECVAVNVKRKMTPLIFFKDENSNWRLDEQGYEQVEEEISSILEEINNFESKKDKEIKRYEFVTFHQSYAYEDFIEGIKPVMEEGSDGDIQYEIKDGLFKKLCQRAGNDPSNSYAIFIDEINRGNVSSIFGELITLIEDDKRLGSENAMTATLPYSRSIFGVPRNVHIYGTMNTADRSVEALDTALRRRFSFLEMLPDSSKLEVAVEGIRLSELLTILNDRIEVLVDRDHTIGHAFFINDKNLDDLRNTFANKVIPLLQEYFYGDYGKMEMVIGSAFFEVKDTTKIKFAVKPEDFDPEGKVYHIVDVADKKTMSDDDFKEALTKLIKGA